MQCPGNLRVSRPLKLSSDRKPEIGHQECTGATMASTYGQGHKSDFRLTRAQESKPHLRHGQVVLPDLSRNPTFGTTCILRSQCDIRIHKSLGLKTPPVGARFGAAQSGPLDGAHGSAQQHAEDDVGDRHKGHEKKRRCRVKECCQSPGLGLQTSSRFSI